MGAFERGEVGRGERLKDGDGGEEATVRVGLWARPPSLLIVILEQNISETGAAPNRVATRANVSTSIDIDISIVNVAEGPIFTTFCGGLISVRLSNGLRTIGISSQAERQMCTGVWTSFAFRLTRRRCSFGKETEPFLSNR